MENVFLDCLSSLGLTQLINVPTHQSGSKLDLIITTDPDIVDHIDVSHSPVVSDHFAGSYLVYARPS